jgi:hypothetical protein
MAISSFDGQLKGDVFEDSPTVRLFLDDALVDDLDYVEPQRMPGMLVVRIEPVDRQTWSSAAVVVVLASVLLALAVILALRLRNSHKHSTGRPVSRAAIARPLDRPASTSARHGSQRRARRRTRRSAHHRRVAIGSTRVPQRTHLVLPVVPTRVVDVSPRRPVPVPARRGEEFGFER